MPILMRTFQTYQYFVMVGCKSVCKILYTAHDCIMNFFPPTKTQPAQPPIIKNVEVKLISSIQFSIVKGKSFKNAA